MKVSVIPERVEVVREKKIVLELSEQEALNLLAITGFIGGAPNNTARGTFSDSPSNTSLAVALKNVLGVSLSYPNNQALGTVIQGSILFTRHMRRDDFECPEVPF